MDDIGRINILDVAYRDGRAYCRAERIEMRAGTRMGVEYQASLPLQGLQGLEETQVVTKLRAAVLAQIQALQTSPDEPSETEALLDSLASRPGSLSLLFDSVAEDAIAILPDVIQELEDERPVENPPTEEELEQAAENTRLMQLAERRAAADAAYGRVLQAQRELAAIESAASQPVSSIPVRARLARARAEYVRLTTEEV